MLFILLQAAIAQSPAETIVVTGAREPVPIAAAPVSATVFEADTIEALAFSLTADLLRLAPGVSVASTGPRGTQTQLRIRGAEANHTLLFVDGIRFNDPAAGNEARFELFTNDALARAEIVRGPQSALWGSEALGGVVAIETGDPFGGRDFAALGEYGSLDSRRASVSGAGALGTVGLSGSLGYLASDGIDSFGSGGERDGFENRSASAKAVFRPRPGGEIGVVGHWIEGESDFDGFDPETFRRADTLDNTKNRIAAIRGWASVAEGGWSAMLEGSYLDSTNRNRLGDDPLNRTLGDRFALGGQVSRRLGEHRLTAAAEYEGESFRARDQVFFGGTDQDRSRDLIALIGEWRAEWSDRLVTDLAVRHDAFSAFEDATTARASALFRPAPALTLHAAYGEGIAQPTFFDLFGFFPGSFVGNPALKPESSTGWEAGLRWRGESLTLGATAFSNHLRDEIVGTFDPDTFIAGAANASGRSRRRGVELEAGARVVGIDVSANFTYLDASERTVAGDAAVREVRRPRHSANLIATGQSGPLRYGASLAYVDERRDTDFDVVPAATVTLDDYVLASLKLAYRLTPQIEAYGRIENAFDASYQDVVGYATAGRTVYAGVRVRLD